MIAATAMSAQEPTAPTTTDEQRVQHRLMLEFGSRAQFDDPKLEYRRLFSEMLGTFMLVLVAAGGGCCTLRARSAWPPPSSRPG